MKPPTARDSHRNERREDSNNSSASSSSSRSNKRRHGNSEYEKNTMMRHSKSMMHRRRSEHNKNRRDHSYESHHDRSSRHDNRRRRHHREELRDRDRNYNRRGTSSSSKSDANIQSPHRRSGPYSTTTATKLPSELLHHIVSYVDFAYLARLACVCRDWERKIYDESSPVAASWWRRLVFIQDVYQFNNNTATTSDEDTDEEQEDDDNDESTSSSSSSSSSAASSDGDGDSSSDDHHDPKQQQQREQQRERARQQSSHHHHHHQPRVKLSLLFDFALFGSHAPWLASLIEDISLDACSSLDNGRLFVTLLSSGRLPHLRRFRMKAAASAVPGGFDIIVAIKKYGGGSGSGVDDHQKQPSSLSPSRLRTTMVFAPSNTTTASSSAAVRQQPHRSSSPLQKLSLSKMRIDQSVILWISRTFPNLTSLKLSHYFTSSEGSSSNNNNNYSNRGRQSPPLSVLRDGKKRMKLETVLLSNIKEFKEASMLAALCKGCPRLTNLTLSCQRHQYTWCGIEERSECEYLEDFAFVSSWFQCKHLRRFKLKKAKITEHGVMLIVNNCPALQSLVLVGCDNVHKESTQTEVLDALATTTSKTKITIL